MRGVFVIKKSVKIGIIALVIILLLMIGVIAVYFAISFGKEDKYKAEIEAFLRQKYNEDFSVSFITNRKALIYYNFNCDGSSVDLFPEGVSEDRTEYVYAFSPLNNLEKKYFIIYEDNSKTGDYIIHEVDNPNIRLCGRESYRDYYGEEIAGNYVITLFKKQFANEYSDIKWNKTRDMITIYFEKNLENEVLNNYDEFEKSYNELWTFMEENYYTYKVQLAYEDYEINSMSETVKDNKSVKIIFAMNEINNQLNNEYITSCMYDETYDEIDVNINRTLKDEIENHSLELEELYYKLKEIGDKYSNVLICIKFNDDKKISVILDYFSIDEIKREHGI